MLVVDDEVENTDFLRRLFRQDFAVEVAPSGEKALELLAAGRFDVIITDQMMPGMTGVELLTRSVALAPDAVRILVTGFPNLEAAIASVNEGRAYRFFTKPLDRNELRDVVSAAIQGQNAARVLRRRVHRLERENRALRHRLGEELGTGSSEFALEAEPVRSGLAIDEETGLLTREALVERLDEEVTRSERFGLLCALVLVRAEEYRAQRDRDPAAADRMLERMSWLIRLRSRRYDLGARWSEDTLALLLPHVGKRGAEARVERMQRAAEASEEGYRPLVLRAAITAYPETHETMEELIAAAEDAIDLR
jgi:diguanylate cyclase (GGDEF)-like protein